MRVANLQCNGEFSQKKRYAAAAATSRMLGNAETSTTINLRHELAGGKKSGKIRVFSLLISSFKTTGLPPPPPLRINNYFLFRGWRSNEMLACPPACQPACQQSHSPL
jgi:hypothetical protein